MGMLMTGSYLPVTQEEGMNYEHVPLCVGTFCVGTCVRRRAVPRGGGGRHAV